MDAIEAIMTRRSIRRYSDEPIDDHLMERLIRAAMAAPSAGNQQPWHLVVIRERDRLSRMAEIHEHAKMASGAAAAVVVCSETVGLKHPGYWQQDCAAAVENLLLAAHASGLGAVWCGIYPKEHRAAAFRADLELPEGIEPLALVVMGSPAEEKPPSERYAPARVHRERW